MGLEPDQKCQPAPKLIRMDLSVPFHGALGAIAGAYIARARFGGVLGSHRRSRWRRPRLFLLAWLISVVLHSLFDASAFSIPKANKNTTEGAVEASLLVLMALVVGFATIVFAALLARRITRRAKGLLQTKRLPLAHWRGVWATVLDRCRLELRGVDARHCEQFWRKYRRVGIAGYCRRHFLEMREYCERSRQTPAPFCWFRHPEDHSRHLLNAGEMSVKNVRNPD